MEKKLILFGIIAITATSNVARVNDNNNQSIVCNINFNYYVCIWAEYSWTMEHKNDTTGYFLFDIKNYANSFDEFITKYPSVTIKTRGIVTSESTFGDVGRNKFGGLNYLTENLWSEKYVHIVHFLNNFDEKWSAYYVKVSIGIGFIRQDTRLFLIPSVAGTITSHGIRRDLDYGLTVETIRFNPHVDISSLTPISSERWIYNRISLEKFRT